MTARVLLGIDVGTASARAGLFDERGRMLGLGTEPVRLLRPAEDFVEQSSDDIWHACAAAVRQALAAASVAPEAVAGIGFDATCSLAVLGERDEPVTVSPSGDDAWNVIVWMDHRATEQAARINATGHEVLRYVGGSVSPEMQAPKLLWLAQNLPASWRRARRFLDLPDFLVYRATGVDARSECTTTCKWTYLAHAGGWREDFFRLVGLGELADEGFVRIGARVRPVGERAGTTTATAAAELGLRPGIPVAVSLIDAHAGGLGVLGSASGGKTLGAERLEERVALICGTSSCHMAVTSQPKFVPGIWGPYYSAMVPGMWLTEGGQSATGALLDHVVFSHARGAELGAQAAREGRSVHALLGERIERLGAAAPFPAALTRELHVLPYHHGNRSPRADPSLRGMASGLRLSDSLDSLALVYLATVQALAHGTRHIIAQMNRHGHRIGTIVATGGGTKGELLLREHADVTGCPVVLPREPEAVLLGAAMVGAVAAGLQPSVPAAMAAMSGVERTIAPSGGEVARYHEAKHAVFLRMYEDQMAYREIMRAPRS
ncbi:MAG: FGGY-family carbohydrate kinase [Deltaproteobacteria bacterium]|nr:FGGY-family carbohydrate kinase [Deltaproteobacteria bacterium]